MKKSYLIGTILLILILVIVLFVLVSPKKKYEDYTDSTDIRYEQAYGDIEINLKSKSEIPDYLNNNYSSYTEEMSWVDSRLGTEYTSYLCVKDTDTYQVIFISSDKGVIIEETPYEEFEEVLPQRDFSEFDELEE